ncbi:hypothetical protein AJ80_01111 [Polytolypa hystricis UAMH7299]|uniref:Uncharacterized protein n=1 Tax=Polytolypa hystricis (strain UAMH7299) TaxID=1447883 RepID=A0A2B7Z0N2_POLH7|nr:hypothetical protein AJ80_01111 [Polytolypa hystricis UAMH7299]
MVVPPSTGATTAHQQSHASSTRSSARASNAAHPSYAPNVPLSARRAAPLDLSTVERRGQPSASREPVKRVRPHGLQEAPTFRPTEDEFKDPVEYIRKIAPEGKKFGICKIIPPDNWTPPFAIDTERFHFRTRRQELNSVEGGTRANLNYLDQLTKFHKQHGMNLSRFPSVDKRPLDLYKLKKAVDVRGGFEQVCKQKKWAEIGRDLGYSGKIMSSLSTSLKNSFQRWLYPYEEYLRVAKPGVQQQLEVEHGGPYTPSPKPSPSTRKQPPNSTRMSDTPMDSPAARASSALNASMIDSDSAVDTPPRPIEAPPPPPPPPKPVATSGFTAVNSGGFSAINTPSSFVAVNSAPPVVKREVENTSVTHSNGKEIPSARGKSEAGTAATVNGDSRSLKRAISHDSLTGGSQTENGDLDSSGRRSKRLKKDVPAPTVAGSHMSLLRPTPPQSRTKNGLRKTGERCENCGKSDNRPSILSCDGCENGYHMHCLDPPITSMPDYDWHCPKCLVGTGEYGFEEGGIYSLKQFQEKANKFKKNYFGPKMPFDPVLNTQRKESEDDVEREFWRLVESLTETVEVEYGADIHSTTHGSGFPTVEKNPLDPYSNDPWNLNVLPLHGDSLFRHIKSDVSGMTVPWVYVGMCFSTFCWHNEDHYTYSANYQHFGATKTWYGIPGADAEAFEEAMRQAVPELFETQPDLLFQLVTLLPPDQLKKANVNVYALDQRAGQFVITFPQAYHAGFNHGFNFNEAVNFAPTDWEPLGQAGVERLQSFRRQPCFSHDELLLTAAARDTSIKTSKWLGSALRRMCNRELEQRSTFIARHKELRQHRCKFGSDDSDPSECELKFAVEEADVPEEEYQCAYCKVYSYLTQLRCHKSGKILCLIHADTHDCCAEDATQRLLGPNHTLRYRMSDEGLQASVQKVEDRARIPEAWQEKLDKVLEDEPKPSLKAMHALLSEGEKIPFHLPGLQDLATFVQRCDKWLEEANNYITRKQQNRRKNEKVWRKGNSAKTAQMEERDRELRNVEKIHALLTEAENLSFDCPQIATLREKVEEIQKFQHDAQAVLCNPHISSTQDVEELVDLGRSFNVDIPEVEKLAQVLQQMKWNDDARRRREIYQTLDDCIEFIAQAEKFNISDTNDHLIHFRDLRRHGETWEAKATELISVEAVHYQQLEALSTQAARFPVSPETLSKVDAILTKQREAQKQINSFYEATKNPDFRKRPHYKDVRELMESLAELNSKPSGTIDLEREQKRHEDWMRRGKKLFGKANAPLHILKMHMQYVDKKNSYCFDLEDRCRPPVEPASREQTPDGPVEQHSWVGTRSKKKDVFCICRQQEAGLMIECEVCHEWYHGKCLKIARGKVKEYDSYTCPICDWRVKIPRDAARPKLEDLMDWQAEVPDLPFQPEEEQILESIVERASTFREFLRPYTNPAVTTSEEVPTQIFYLRKIEGAEVLLAYETNYFRQEIHKWSPLAPDPPPILEQSLSTRKPRPTKQQKIMAQLGIEKPEDLPIHLRTKQHSFSNKRKSTEAQTGRPPPLQPAPSNRSHTPSGDPRSASTGNVQTPPATTLAPMSGSQPPSSYAYSHPFPMSNEASPTYPPGSSAFLPQVNPVHSPSFAPTSPENHHPGLDPSLFSPPSFSRAPLRAQDSIGKEDSGMDISGDSNNPFGSSSPPRGNIDDIFADLTNQDPESIEAMEMSHANEALETLRSANTSAGRERSLSASGEPLDEPPSRESEFIDGDGSSGQERTSASTTQEEEPLETPSTQTEPAGDSSRTQDRPDLAGALADEFLNG